MRDYQCKKNNDCIMPDALYMAMLSIVRDYERLNKERRYVKNPDMMNQLCVAVEEALQKVPNEYRDAILDNICRHAKYPDVAHRNTYSKWRVVFLNAIAKNLNLL